MENVLTDLADLDKGMEAARKELERLKGHRSVEAQQASTILSDFINNSTDKLKKVQFRATILSPIDIISNLVATSLCVIRWSLMTSCFLLSWVMFSFKGISKKGLFFFYIMYFLLYNPNLKFVFCGRTYKYFFMFFDLFVWLG